MQGGHGLPTSTFSTSTPPLKGWLACIRAKLQEALSQLERTNRGSWGLELVHSIVATAWPSDQIPASSSELHWKLTTQGGSSQPYKFICLKVFGRSWFKQQPLLPLAFQPSSSFQACLGWGGMHLCCPLSFQRCLLDCSPEPSQML